MNKRGKNTETITGIADVLNRCQFGVFAAALVIAFAATTSNAIQVCPDTVTKPYDFTPATPAKASEVNENFDVLYEALNQMSCEIIALRSELEDTKLNLPGLGGDVYNGDAFKIDSASVTYEPKLDSLIFTMTVDGDAASVVPVPAGSVNGAPVLGYVFATTLSSSDVGFGTVSGTVALAVTSHPDFDDTPYWDEDNNEAYDDDGVVYHSHWVVLEENGSAGAGLSVVQKPDGVTLPMTVPMEMYLDSPGFAVLEDGSSISVIVPLDRVQRNTAFSTDAVTAYMQVDATGDKPLLKVETVYSKLSDGANVTPHLTVTDKDNAQAVAEPWPTPVITSTPDTDDSFTINSATVQYVKSIDTLVFSMNVAGTAGQHVPMAAGSVNGGAITGAPVLGYVFPTSLAPGCVNFQGLDGTLALAVTSHPDFDDTPLWDESRDDDYDNDGTVYHVHWAVLETDESDGSLSVPSQTDLTKLPKTAPMPMYLDSPGFHAFASGGQIRVIVPAQRVDNTTSFMFDAVTVEMSVDLTSGNPVLNVDNVLSAFGGSLTITELVQEVATLGDL